MPVRMVRSPQAPRRIARPFVLVETGLLKGEHSWRVRSVAVSANGTIASASSDKSVCIWSKERLLQKLTGHSGEVNGVVFVEYGSQQFLVSGGSDKTLRVWDIASGGKSLHVFEDAHRGDVSALAFSTQKSASVVSGSADKNLKLWSLDEAGVLTEQRKLSGHKDAVTAVASSSDGSLIASSSYDGTLRLWSATQGIELRSIGHSAPVTALAIAPDAKTVVTGTNDGALRLWSGSDGTLLFEMIRAHSDKVSSLCYVDSACVASGGRDDHVRLHSLANGKQLAASKNHVDCVVSLAIAHDGSFLASGAHDQTVRLWRVH